MTRPEDPIARAERITAELRAATSEAAGAVKDLRVAMREAREQVEGYLHDVVQADLDGYTAKWQAGCDAFFAEFICQRNELASHHMRQVVKLMAERDTLVKAADCMWAHLIARLRAAGMAIELMPLPTLPDDLTVI